MVKDWNLKDIAKVCGVSAQTVKHWIDRKELKGYRLPLSNTRRVTQESLLAFMKQHGLPLEPLREVRPEIELEVSG
jgi:excisionase family DNA binding protein